uniref:AlNc14C239G9444 protein n=1 Tax=Albugo laibachii Nc14 TaxID=890382 RepID=F0WSU9_9STRA|nr:AlNc14C239G9444 [Albugo laibachii Nc14]|eukprot:CCA24427.1 AlNc14C239G9444 [Albugo laibachii Nc14]
MFCVQLLRTEKAQFKCDHPVAVVRLDSDWSVTSGAKRRDTEFFWGGSEGSTVELYIDRLKTDKYTLTIELYANWYLDDMIGLASLDVSNEIKALGTGPITCFTPLYGPHGNRDNIGSLMIHFWCLPPLRGPFQSLKQVYRVMAARDHLLAAIQIMLKAVFQLAFRGSRIYIKYSSPFTYHWMNRILSNQNTQDWIVSHRQWIELIGGFLAGLGSGLLVIGGFVSGVLALVTLPFWIIPTFSTLLWWSPIWLPLCILSIPAVLSVVVGIGLLLATSHPIRSIGSTAFAKLKRSKLGNWIFYTESYNGKAV